MLVLPPMTNIGKILVIGANGQIGVELTQALGAMHGYENVIAADIRQPAIPHQGPFELLDITRADDFIRLVVKHNIKQVYHLAALLSATGEQYPLKAWSLNMDSLLLVLETARTHAFTKVFWPSSIAVFGPTTPRHQTPQTTIMEPGTMYGITKQAGENLCAYYHHKFGVDVRSIRYPGLISWKGQPGGGTTDYAVDIFHQAVKTGRYTCFLQANTFLPMLYMDDAISATIQLMEAPKEQVKIRTAYNLGGMSFEPNMLAEEIKKIIPDFVMDYLDNDSRQAIADSWPASIDDSHARHDWGFEPRFDLKSMTADMIKNLRQA